MIFSSRYNGRAGSISLLFPSGISIITILTITLIRQTQISVMVMLNTVCAFAICLEITSISGPFGEIYWISAANGFTNQIKRKQPEILKIQWATAVLFASLLCPILARSAVIVVPMLSPSRIGIAPARPRILVIPSAPGCAAKFWRTAMVALLLCTTRVISVPTPTPKTGICATFPIRSVKTWLEASGFITSPMVSIPRKRSPNAKMVCPILFIFSDFVTKAIINPIKMIM